MKIQPFIVSARTGRTAITPNMFWLFVIVSSRAAFCLSPESPNLANSRLCNIRGTYDSYLFPLGVRLLTAGSSPVAYAN